MSDPHFGLDKPDQESLTQPLGVQPLPLALLPTSQQGSPTMTRLATVGQGGRISVRSTASNGVSDATIASLLSNQSNSLPNLVSTLNSPRKRKLPPEEYVVLRRKVTESKTLSLRRLQTSYAEHCALLCFLQENGQPADYSAWRNRLPPIPLTNFLHVNKLNPADENEDLFAVLLTSEHSPLNTSIPIGRTSQGNVLPDASKSVSSTVNNVDKTLSPTKFVKCPTVVRTSTPLKSSSPQQLQSPSGSVENTVSSQEQIVEKAKQEAYVMQRIGELQRDGLWAEKRLPKVHELPRAKAHWDYLIEEMVWLAADFAQERKWKKAAAKKCARMVQKYFQEKEILAQKAVKAKEMQLKRIASCMAKEIKQFWANVEKLVEFKQQTRLEEKRKKALDQHLSFIVDQTEKYSSLVAESMNTSHQSSPRHSDVEFEPDGSSDDDEETIAKEEALDEKDEAAISAEVDALKRESEIPLEELLSEYLAARDSVPSSPRNENQDDEDYKVSDKDSSDDEETIQEQEVAEGAVDYKKEIDELKAEGDMSIEELRAKYGQLEDNVKDNIQAERESDSETDIDLITNDKTGNEEYKDEDDDDDEDDDNEEEEDEEDEEEDEEEEEEEEDQKHDKKENEESDKEDTTLKTLLTDTSESSNVPGDKEINDVAAIAQSLQPKGNTLSSTSVVTKIPFLLKHTLREYQHIGLDWLVTMHDRKLNGILADEMGLGKTIQTIALLAHLACEKGNWGPHLIVVPTSVMLNWEMEFKKWCPAFKILTYYGTQKERKMKRAGWTKPNAFHVCITSYKLVIQDHQSFRRKKWKYLILDEAQNIKNFKSQRWQLLLNFQTQRRLLLTGTPLQNNLMELWSLMHFLMPNVFESHKEFKEWFSNPVTGMIEGNSEYNDTIIKRLHKVLRPFLLRRLKTEVETQMPKKYEHIVMCRLSNRQRYLYDDFMSRAKTKETLATGSLLSVINVLMQLRKVCNHPNLFEVRPTVSPFQMEGLAYSTASLVYSALDYDPFKSIDLSCLNLLLVEVELWLLAFVAHRAKRYKTPSPLIEEIDSAPPDPPLCPKGKIKIHVRRSLVPSQTTQVGSPVRPAVVQVGNNHRLITSLPTTKVGTSPLIKTLISQGAPNQGVTLRLANPSGQIPNYLQLLQQPGGVKAIPVASLGSTGQVVKTGEGTTGQVTRIVPQFAQLVNTPSGRQLVLSQQGTSTATVMTTSGQRLTVVSKQGGGVTRIVTPAVAQLNARPIMRVPPLNVTSSAVVTQQNVKTVTSNSTIEATPTSSTTSNSPVTNPVTSPTKQIVTRQSALNSSKSQSQSGKKSLGLKDEKVEALRRNRRKEKLKRLATVNETRCQSLPIYGVDLVSSLQLPDIVNKEDWKWTGSLHCRNAAHNDPRLYWNQTSSLSSAVNSIEERVQQLSDIFSRFVLCVPAVSAPCPKLHVSHPAPWKLHQEQKQETMLQLQLKPKFRLLHPIASAMSTQFPDPRLIQYDCGKLQSLDRLLRRLKSEHHRALIFTQMTRMLDVLEAFLNFHGHIYLRLDGTTKVDQRQVLMDRFNNDRRIFCFILSTRSGGVGVNLTGADTVIFYDSDWNPTMDAQAQDRCHRIGQTRDVHIYRLVSEKTVEENILKKANQKRMLGDIAIEGGNFTTAYFKSSTIQDLFNVDVSENDASNRMAEVLQRDGEKRAIEDSSQSTSSGSEEKAAIGALESALAQAEDETDVAAAKVAKAEAAAELAEFDENIPLEQQEGQELSKAETELNSLMQQLSGVERYAMKFVEETESAWSAEQLAAAEAEIEQQKREWELGRLAALKDEECERKRKAEAETEDMITYSGTDARNQVWVNQTGKEIMPMWCPPTPPQDDSDVYIDHALGLLYDRNVMSEAQLPPVFVKKDKKRTRLEAGLPDGRHPVKVRQREDTLMHAPRSLFDRPTPALIKMRQELRLQKYRGLMRPSVQNLLKPTLPVKPLPEPEHVPDWVIQEDWTILQAIQQIQEMTLNLVVLSPGHTPNWDMVADMVNMTSRTYRSPKQCRNRYESVIVPREEGKIVFDSPKKQKKNKAIYKLPQMKSGRPLRTSQLFQQDNNSSMTQVMNSRFDAIRSVSNKRAPTVKPLLVDPAMKNPKHAEVLADCSIDYDKPLTPVEVATKRADRIAKEKQAAVATEQQLAVLRLQQQQLQNAPKSSSASSSTGSSPITSQASTSAGRQVATLTVQEMVAGVQANRTVVSSSSNSSPTSQQRTAANLLAVQTSSASSTPSKGTKSISPAQLQMYRQQQALLRQQLRVLQSRNTSSSAASIASGAKVSVAVSGASQTQRVQSMKPGGVTRAVTESEMVALLKRQQAAKGTTTTTLTPAQLLAQASIQTQQTTSPTQVGQVATLVKTVPATSLPVAGITLPQMKAALGTNVKTSTVTTQQIRQLSIQQQLLAQQRKLPQQKITQLSQVAGKSGAPAQLIVQSQKTMPTTMTMQQIQQVMKHHVVMTGGNSAGATRTSVPSVTIDASGRSTVSVATALAGAIKAGTSAQQQAILTQVSAVLQQQGQPITVRQPVRIQTTTTPLVAVAVSQAPPTVLTLPPSDNTQSQ